MKETNVPESAPSPEKAPAPKKARLTAANLQKNEDIISASAKEEEREQRPPSWPVGSSKGN